MFEFEYDNFTDKCNGLKIVIRNTAKGQLVCYVVTNNSSEFLTDRYSEVTGHTFIMKIRLIILNTMYPARLVTTFFEGKTNNNNWSIDTPTSAPTEEYLNAKQEEILELATKKAEEFLLNYFQVENMRDLLARDDFFDKPMFVEP